MEIFLENLLFISLGGCVGSFASMLIYRLPHPDTSINILSPRSFCPSCKTPLSLTQLIPFFGYLANQGKCSKCSKQIDGSYLFNEIFTAALLIYLINLLGIINPLTWLIFSIAMILYVQALMDFKTLLLSQPLSFLLILIGLVANLGFEIFAVPLDALLGLLFGYGLLFSINILYKMLRSQDGIGSGDFLLLSGIGSILGASAIGPILLLGSSLTICIYVISKDPKIKELPLGFGLGFGGIMYLLMLMTLR
ncbi:prepilin peptidase [Gammaproteobacteria bacterium]|nr:prepilin peptidase [Gammaproteobacteria bacterium]